MTKKIVSFVAAKIQDQDIFSYFICKKAKLYSAVINQYALEKEHNLVNRRDLIHAKNSSGDLIKTELILTYLERK